MEHSIYQKAIFSFVENSDKQNAIVAAGPGSGKTTTIIECCKRVPPGSSTIVLSFSKLIADELAARVPFGIESATLNAAGWKVCRDQGKMMRLNKWKTLNKLKKECDNGTLMKVRGCVLSLISLMKAYCVFKPCKEIIEEIAAKQGIDIPDVKNIHNIIINVYNASIADVNEMDFDDQIFQPLYRDWEIPKYDFVFVDEAQDLSTMNREYIKAMCHEATVCLFVGDEWQSIFGFRGADVDSMDKIKEEFNAVTLPLSVCYRCPDRIIDEARKINPGLEKPEINHNGEGIVETVSKDYFRSHVKETDYVLCRTTAPLIKECLKLLPKMYCYVRGRNIGEGLFKHIDTIAPNNIAIGIFKEKLEDYTAKTIKKLKELERESQLAIFEDEIESINALLGECEDVDSLRNLIYEIIPEDENGRGVCFMTMHRAKGLETQDGWILRRDLVPHSRSTLPWQRKQEDHLLFVAITRFQRSLRYVLKEKGEK